MEDKLIKKIAWKVYNSCIAGRGYEHLATIEDLIHFGVIGYLDAEQKYSKEKGGNWNHYVSTRIHGEIISGVRKLPQIRLPQEQWAKVKDLGQARQELEMLEGEATGQAVAQKLNWDLKKIDGVAGMVPRLCLVDTGGQDDEEHGPATIKLSGGTLPCEQILENEIGNLIQRCLELVEPAEDRLIISARFLGEMKLCDLAESFGVSTQRVHQRMKRGLGQMRNCFETNDWTWDEDDG
jgi:RNA polymerase sigma factor (sigma-70 family)